jgi:hypothetical protein
MHHIHFCVEGPMKRQEIPWLVSVKSSRFEHSRHTPAKAAERPCEETRLESLHCAVSSSLVESPLQSSSNLTTLITLHHKSLLQRYFFELQLYPEFLVSTHIVTSTMCPAPDENHANGTNGTNGTNGLQSNGDHSDFQ